MLGQVALSEKREKLSAFFYARTGLRSVSGMRHWTILKKQWPLIALICAVIVIYRGWLAPGAIHYGDWIYNPAARIQDYWPVPSLWDGAFGTGSANMLSGPMLPILFLEALLNRCGLPATLCMRLLWIFPGILFCAGATYALAVTFFHSRLAGVLGGLFAVTNTYIANIATGGQFTVGMGYWLMPLILLLFYRALKHPRPGHLALTGLSIAVQVMYDLRSTYLTLGVLLVFACMYTLAQPSLGAGIRIVLVIVVQFMVMGLIGVLVHSYWLLPAHFSQSDAVALPAGYDQTVWVYRLSYMQLSHAFAFVHPFWYQATPSPHVSAVTPLFLLLPIPIFAVLLRRRLTYIELFLGVLALLAIFLVKGSNPPAGDVYTWLFRHIPGFSMFRDPSKFYQPLGLAYSLLLGRAAMIALPLARCERPISKVAAVIGRSILPVVCIVFILLQVVPVATNTWWGTLAPQPVPTEFNAFNHFIDNQKGFFRVLWYSGFSDFASYSTIHPVIGADSLGQAYLASSLPDRSDQTAWSHLRQEGQRILNALSVRFIAIQVYSHAPAQVVASSHKDVRLIRQLFPSLPEKQFGDIYVFENKHYVPEVFIPGASDSKTLSAKLPRLLSLRKTHDSGVLGDIASICSNCFSLVSSNHTRFEVVIRHPMPRPFVLVMNQAYDPNWAAYLEPSRASQPFWWTWLHSPLPDRYHFKVNGFANAWLITDPHAQRIVVEYRPQRWTDIGWVIAWLSVLGCVTLALVSFVWKRQRHERLAAGITVVGDGISI